MMGCFTLAELVAKAYAGGILQLLEGISSKFGVNTKENAEMRKDLGKDGEIHPGM